ncbi:hypothetical protein PR048_020342 [Dryococelus australis]|uniref:Reverse transcriptase RNase H-like domain-containing protein n=1 Tax=Dryococelus australis TaxID=614101 RepID=A0ABQ9H624_9NEOP|nr:hypothetical protein PR048_020342 [Dryococelus australis]
MNEIGKLRTAQKEDLDRIARLDDHLRLDHLNMDKHKCIIGYVTEVHKEVVERQVQDMLENDIIKPSTFHEIVHISPKKVDVSGRKFTICIDHRPLTWILSVKDPSSRLMQWQIKISEYDFEIRYQKGSTIMHADGLSRSCADEKTIRIPGLAALSSVHAATLPPNYKYKNSHLAGARDLLWLNITSRTCSGQQWVELISRSCLKVRKTWQRRSGGGFEGNAKQQLFFPFYSCTLISHKKGRRKDISSSLLVFQSTHCASIKLQFVEDWVQCGKQDRGRKLDGGQYGCRAYVRGGIQDGGCQNEMIEHDVFAYWRCAGRRPPHPCPPPKLRAFREIIEKLLEAGVIEPTTSDYCSPGFLVKKKDNDKYRMVVNSNLFFFHVFHVFILAPDSPDMRQNQRCVIGQTSAFQTTGRADDKFTQLFFILSTFPDSLSAIRPPSTIVLYTERGAGHVISSCCSSGGAVHQTWSSLEMQGKVKQENLEKTCQPATSICTIPICETNMVTLVKGKLPTTMPMGAPLPNPMVAPGSTSAGVCAQARSEGGDTGRGLRMAAGSAEVTPHACKTQWYVESLTEDDDNNSMWFSGSLHWGLKLGGRGNWR